MQGGMGREESKHNPVVHPKVPPLCTAGSRPHPKAHGPPGLHRLSGTVRGAAAWPPPAQVTELQFEVAAMGLSSSRSMLELVGCRLL